MSDPQSTLSRFIRWVMRDTLYHGRYPSVVQLQHADGTVDLLPDDPRVRGTGLSRVPVRHGLPGVDVRVVVGSRVLLGYENGDPRAPYAGMWEPGNIDSISFDGGQAPVARQGDVVVVHWPASVPITGTVGGNALVGTITIATPGSGVIQSGASKVKA